VVAAVAAVVFFGAGVITWRMMSQHWYAIHSILYAPQHRLHPLRAELLWAASTLFAVVAIGAFLQQKRRPGTAQTASESASN
jgi:uncharacterized membrane protein